MVTLVSTTIERIAAIFAVIILGVATGYYYYEYTLLNNNPSSGPAISSQTTTVSTDLNWGGYAVASDFNNPQPIVTEVSGSWIVPQVTITQSDTFSAIWIGIGGTFGNTLIQAGTEQDSIDGQAVYSAWFELLPQDSVIIPTINVSPGDTIDACINPCGFEYQLMDDINRRRNYGTEFHSKLYLCFKSTFSRMGSRKTNR